MLTNSLTTLHTKYTGFYYVYIMSISALVLFTFRGKCFKTKVAEQRWLIMRGSSRPVLLSEAFQRQSTFARTISEPWLYGLMLFNIKFYVLDVISAIHILYFFRFHCAIRIIYHTNYYYFMETYSHWILSVKYLKLCCYLLFFLKITWELMFNTIGIPLSPPTKLDIYSYKLRGRGRFKFIHKCVLYF